MRGMQKRALTGTDVPASKARTSSSTGKALVRWGVGVGLSVRKRTGNGVPLVCAVA